MKNLLITFWVICISASLQAQINIPKDTTWQHVGDTILYLDTFNIIKLGEVIDDSIMYENREYPHFVNQQLVDDVWYELSMKDNYIVGNDKWIPERKPTFYMLRSGAVVVAQKWKHYEKIIRDYSHGKQLWWYGKKAKEIEVTPDQLWIYPEVDTILNWDIYFPRDTVILDTTQ